MRKIVMTSVVVMIMAVGAQAAVYDWNGNANNGTWFDAGNWTVTGSASGWTYPNDQDDGAYTNRDCEEINITNGDTVSVYSISVDGMRDGSTTNVLTVSNGSTLGFGNALWIADYPGTNGTVNLTNATMNVASLIDIGNDPGASSTAALNITDSNVSVTGGSGDIRVGVQSGTDSMTVSGNSTVDIVDDLLIAVANSSDPGADATVTVNGGLVKVGAVLNFVDDEGTAKFYLNGGRVQTHELRDVDQANADFIYTGGELLVNQATMSESDMNTLISNGDIDVSGAASWSVTTMNVDGTNYTALVPEPASIGLLLFGFGLLFRRRK